MHIFVPHINNIHSENSKVLPIAIQKLTAFDKFGFLTFHLEGVDCHPRKVVRHKFSLRSTIPENLSDISSKLANLAVSSNKNAMILERFVQLQGRLHSHKTKLNHRACVRF